MGRPIALTLLSVAALGGCAEPAVTGGIIGGVAGTAALGVTPGSKLKQVFYLGSFDPQGQLPPEVYRITVRGEASMISRNRFASGWVPAILADSLASNVTLDANTGTVLTQPAPKDAAIDGNALGSGRRLVMFGPDGFREAPRGHRLVLTMGTNADAYFDAIDQTLGYVADLQTANSDAQIGLEVLERQRAIDAERETLTEMLVAIYKDKAEASK